MKVALAQINPTVADFAGNRDLIDAAIAGAKDRGAVLCVLPELALCGYPPHDLLERASFVEACATALDDLVESVRGIAVIVGTVRPNPDEVGKRLNNCAVLIEDGVIRSTHVKALLPTYDVFDERRYFEPGGAVSLAELGGLRLGITICEDIWSSAGDVPPLYDRDPVAELVELGADLIVNVAASPFTLAKRAARPAMLADVARIHGRPVIMVNQVGGNDDLVFDGHSLALDANGQVLARASELAPDLVLVDLEAGRGDVREPCANDVTAALEALTLGTRDYGAKCGFSSAVLGLSGGIDSALVAAIAARAFGPENVHGVSMPSRYSSEGSKDDAAALAANLGIHYHTLPIDDLFQAYLDKLAPVFDGLAADVTEENIQARLRAVLVMALSNKHGHLVLTTGNKSESAAGYATLYGDMAGGLAVIADVPKTLVYRICEELNRDGELIPKAIIDKPPSAELAPGQRDDDSLPPYDVLDRILELHVDQGRDVAEIVAAGFDESTVRDVARLVRTSEYKRRQAAPALKITSKAFGFGRRMPLAHRWKG